MKLTFSKTILATIVLGLTACGSSGGGKSSPTTSAKRDYITVPKTNHIFSQPPKKTNTTANTTSSTGNSSAVSSKPSENPNNNMAENRPVPSSTFATNNDGLPRGTATYYSNVGINPETFIKMNVDFDKRLVSGDGVIQGIDGTSQNYDKDFMTLIDVKFLDATLFKSDSTISANGRAIGIARNDTSEKFSGGYVAEFGSQYSTMKLDTQMYSNISNSRSNRQALYSLTRQ